MKTEPLYEYQQRVSDFVARRPRTGMFVFYGGGKTYLSLKWLESLNSPFPALVLTMKSLIHQWGKEIEKHTNFSYTLVQGGAKKRVEALASRALTDLFVINYDAVRSAKVLSRLSLIPFRTVIADESTLLKESRTKRFNVIRRLASKIPYKALLTGKPILERPEEIWSQMLFLDDGQTFGRSFWKFRNTYFSPGPPWQPYDWTLKPGAEEAIAKALNQSCIRIPKSVVAKQLPPKNYMKVYFEMPFGAREMYKELKREFRVELPSGVQFGTLWAMSKAQKLHEICQGVFYKPEGDYDLIHEAKLEWIEENIPLMLTNGPVLIWTNFRHCIPLIRATLLNSGVKSTGYHGQMSAQARDNSLKHFLAGKVDVLILSEAAGHAGLNLQRANQAVFYSTGYSAGMRENAEDRCHRIGSEVHESITYYDLVIEKSIDEVVLKAISEKLVMADEILKHMREE